MHPSWNVTVTNNIFTSHTLKFYLWTSTSTSTSTCMNIKQFKLHIITLRFNNSKAYLPKFPRSRPKISCDWALKFLFSFIVQTWAILVHSLILFGVSYVLHCITYQKERNLWVLNSIIFIIKFCKVRLAPVGKKSELWWGWHTCEK